MLWFPAILQKLHIEKGYLDVLRGCTFRQCDSNCLMMLNVPFAAPAMNLMLGHIEQRPSFSLIKRLGCCISQNHNDHE
jgi:hypothetical protein